MLRALQKTNGEALTAFAAFVHEAVEGSELNSGKEVRAASERVAGALQDLQEFALNHADVMEVAARDFAYSLARTFVGALLVEQANSRSATRAERWAAARWCLNQDLCPVKSTFDAGLLGLESLRADREMLEPGEGMK